MIKVQIKKVELGTSLDLPSYSTIGSAGIDLKAAILNDITIKPGELKIIPTGIALAIPTGYEGQVRPRSGLAAKNQITVLNTPGTIDSDYRGEVKILLMNFGNRNFIVTPGMRVAQMVFAKYEIAEFLETDNLEDTQRGEGGFGSTGV